MSQYKVVAGLGPAHCNFQSAAFVNKKCLDRILKVGEAGTTTGAAILGREHQPGLWLLDASVNSRLYGEYVVSMASNPSQFAVNIMVHAAGPVRPRTKYKEHKLLRAEGSITLPFVPFPGLYVTFSKPRKRGEPMKLYLRIRAVEWSIADKRFECVADEMLGSPLFSELHEVRGDARIEKHFAELQNTLRELGFDVTTDAAGMIALHKWEDGTVPDGQKPIRN